VAGQRQPLQQAVLRSLCVHVGCVTLSFPPWHTVDLCVRHPSQSGFGHSARWPRRTETFELLCE
jgi:hypothetical protein